MQGGAPGTRICDAHETCAGVMRRGHAQGSRAGVMRRRHAQGSCAGVTRRGRAQASRAKATRKGHAHLSLGGGQYAAAAPESSWSRASSVESAGLHRSALKARVLRRRSFDGSEAGARRSQVDKKTCGALGAACPVRMTILSSVTAEGRCWTSSAPDSCSTSSCRSSTCLNCSPSAAPCSPSSALSWPHGRLCPCCCSCCCCSYQTAPWSLGTGSTALCRRAVPTAGLQSAPLPYLQRPEQLMQIIRILASRGPPSMSSDEAAQ